MAYNDGDKVKCLRDCIHEQNAQIVALQEAVAELQDANRTLSQTLAAADATIKNYRARLQTERRMYDKACDNRDTWARKYDAARATIGEFEDKLRKARRGE